MSSPMEVMGVTEHACQQCAYQVASQTGRRPSECPQCGGSLSSVGGGYSAAVREFADEHGLDPAEVERRRSA